MRALVFLDLDDTLFQSLKKCPVEQDLYAAAYLRDGQTHSFMTPKQQALWQLLAVNATLIPTTARDRDALSRVHLPFQSFSIINYGGVILMPDGTLDADWQQRMEPLLQAAIPDLESLLTVARDFSEREHLALRIRIIEDSGHPFYLVAKFQHDLSGDLDQLQQRLIQPWINDHDGYRLHRNGNNLAVLPRTLGKEQAVRYLIERLRSEGEELLTIGIGDSLIDGAFMAECDYSVLPQGSQLFAEIFRRFLLETGY